MSALAQSIATSLGASGAGYGAARDQQTAESNQVSQVNFERAMRVKQFILEQQQQKRLADQAELQNRVQSALMEGAWQASGVPVKMQGGGYGMVEHNSRTGDVRVRPLPEGAEPQSDDEVKWEQYANAYKQAFGKEAPDDLKTAFFNKQAGVPAPKEQTEFDAWRAAFKTAHGREPNSEEISQWHRQPKATGAGTDDDLDAFAQQVATKNLTLAQVPSKVRGPLLKYMRSQGMKLPNQLAPAVENTLTQQADALQNTVNIIEQIRPDLDLLKTLPTASLTELAQSPNTVEGALTRWFGVFQSKEDKMRVERLAGNLRSLQESINTIRKPLGATGFRGKEGWDALQNQTVRTMAAPGVNAQVLNNTERFAQSLLNSTNKILGGEDAAPAPSGDLHFDSKGNIIAAPATK